MVNNQKATLVILNRSYWPDMEATGQLLTDLCRDLSRRFDVHVICGQPNRYHAEQQFVQSGIEKHLGVTIHRLSHTRFNKRFPAGRLVNLLSFSWAVERYLKQARLQPDVVVSQTDPFFLPLVGKRYAQRVQAKHCVSLQDLYPDVAQAVGKCRIPGVAGLLRSKLRAVYEAADRLFVVGGCMRERLAAKPWGIARSRLHVIPNWADCAAIRPIDHADNPFRQSIAANDQFVVMHSGNMGLTQQLDRLVRAACDINWPDDAKLILIGSGAAKSKLRTLINQCGAPLGRIELMDYQPREMLAESLSAADLHVASMHPNIAGCLSPSKLYGILAAGRPLLAIGPRETELQRTIGDNDLGWCLDSADPIRIANTVAAAESEFRSNPLQYQARCQRARRLAIRRYDRTVITGRFGDHLEQLAAKEWLETAESLETGPIPRRSRRPVRAQFESVVSPAADKSGQGHASAAVSTLRVDDAQPVSEPPPISESQPTSEEQPATACSTPRSSVPGYTGLPNASIDQNPTSLDNR